MEEILKDYSDVLTINDVQKILKIGRNSAYALIKRGDIKVKYVGKKIIVPKISVVKFLLSA